MYHYDADVVGSDEYISTGNFNFLLYSIDNIIIELFHLTNRVLVLF